MAPSTLELIDLYLAEVFAGWDVYTSILAVTIAIFVAYPLLTWKDPDTHPLLLARQASASPVRNKGESAAYRSNESPYGYPLRSGLNVKDPDAQKWSSGRNGDLRDIWRQAVGGQIENSGALPDPSRKMITIQGREKVVERHLDDITQEINIIGQHVNSGNGKVVAICLSNSVELLSSIFAAAFYGFQAVLIPQHLPLDTLTKILSESKADYFVAETGRLELDAVVKSCPNLAHVLWVTNEGSRHMGWDEVPAGIGGKVEISVWHELVEEKKSSTSSEVLPSNKDLHEQPLRIADTDGTIHDYTSQNIVSGVAGLIFALPRNERLSSKDTVLPTTSLAEIYPLTMIFAALFSNATIILNSVAGSTVDIAIASHGTSSTILITSSGSILKLHSQLQSLYNGTSAKLSRYWQKKSLDIGVMPGPNALTKVVATRQPSFSKLRLVVVNHDAVNTQRDNLTAKVMEDMRMLLGARIAHALTSSQVAGAICQTNVFDYRDQNPGDIHRFGPPLGSVEIKLVQENGDIDDERPAGQLVVQGPAVCGGVAKLDFSARIADDNTVVC